MFLYCVKLNNGFAYVLENKKSQILISPFHVLCNEYLKNGLYKIDSSSLFRNDLPMNLNSIKGEISQEFDFSIAFLQSKYSSKNRNEIDPKFIAKSLKHSQFLFAQSYNLTQNLTITFNTKTQTFSKLIVTDKISSKGCSGMLVLNNSKQIIGMLIADSASKSFILPLSNLNTYIKSNSDFFN